MKLLSFDELKPLVLLYAGFNIVMIFVAVTLGVLKVIRTASLDWTYLIDVFTSLKVLSVFLFGAVIFFVATIFLSLAVKRRS
jgi:hypothetical protein